MLHGKSIKQKKNQASISNNKVYFISIFAVFIGRIHSGLGWQFVAGWMRGVKHIYIHIKKGYIIIFLTHRLEHGTQTF